MRNDRRPQITRADLPDEFTPDTVRELPIQVIGRLSRPGNGVLDAEEQAAFDAAVHTMMSQTASRLSGRVMGPDWANVVREANRAGGRRGGPGRDRTEEQVRRLARRISQQVDLAQGLAPGVDWSFAQLDELARPADSTTGSTTVPPDEPEPEPHTEPEPQPEPAPSDDSGGSDDHGSGDARTVSDLEQQLSDQVELVQVMTEMTEVSKRTYALEQERDLQNTRTVFFGFVVSVAVLVAGWAPIVAAEDWSERLWVLGLTVLTCVLAGAVYALTRWWQNRHLRGEDD